MVQQTILVGTVPDDDSGDPLRDGGIKINANFDELYLDKHTHANDAILDAIEEAFTTTLKDKLDAIEPSATADQSGAEIKILYEAELNTNAFTTDEQTKLGTVTTGADVTADNETSHATVLEDADFISAGYMKRGAVAGDYLIQATPIPTTDTAAKCTDATADNTAANETSHATVLEDSDIGINVEAFFTKNTAFNKSFGTGVSTVCQGNDARLSDARIPLGHTHPLAQITDSGAMAAFDDALSDGQEYVRKNGAWAVATGGGGGGDLLADGTIPLTANWDVGAFAITALRFVSDQVTGIAPFSVASTTVVANLNADLLDGNEAAAFEPADATILKEADVDDVPVDAATTAPISSNWAHDHAATHAPANADNTALNETSHTDVLVDADIGLNVEAFFTKNNAFNLSFGTGLGTVCQGNDARLSDDRDPTAHNHTLADVTDSGAMAAVADALNDGNEYVRKNLAWVIATGGGASSWLDLTDTDPTTFVGQTGKVVAVNAAADGLEFVDNTGSGTFLGLTDVDPSSYVGQAGRAVVVNAGATGLEFVVAAGGGDLKADGTVPLTADWDVGAFVLTALRFVSDQATGTAPFSVASTTLVANLNADLLDGNEASAFEPADATIVKDADFASNGYLKRTAAGVYAVQAIPIPTTDTAAKCTDATADNTAANETSHATVLDDADFVSNGYMKRTAAGVYGIQTAPIPVSETDAKCTDATADNTATNETSHANVTESNVAEAISALWGFNPSGLGGLADYDLAVGDTDGTPTYGIIRIGNSIIGRTSYNVASLDLDGAFLIRNVGSPATSNIEFAFAESTNDIRFAIPKSGVGNATYNPRSMLIAGPAPADDAMVTVGYWQGQGIFDNLVCNTGLDGADLGVQNDLEVEGDIFIDNILESTTAAGVTIDGLLIKDAGIPEAAVTAHEAALSITNSQVSDFAAGVTANETSHTGLITSTGVTFENLDANADVGSGAAQVAQGNHTHAPEERALLIPCSDEATDLVAGTNVVSFRMPLGFSLTAIKGSLSTAATGTVLVTVDINKNGTSIMTNRVTFDAGEDTSKTAVTQPSLISTPTALADDDKMTMDIDLIGDTTAGKGLKIYLIGTVT